MDIQETPNEFSVQEAPKKTHGYDDIFKRWLLSFAELTACAVLSLLGTVEIYHVFSAMEYEGGKAEDVSVMSMLKDTAWATPYACVLFVFLAAVLLFGIALFVRRMQTSSLLSGMLTVTVLFTACQFAGMYSIITMYAKKTLGGIPYETGLTEVGILYVIVSVFAVLELALALRAVRKQRKEATESCDESM